MGMCSSRTVGKYPLDSLQYTDSQKQTMDDNSRAEIEANKHKLNSFVPGKFQLKLENPDGQKMSENSPVLDWKGEDEKNRSWRLYKSIEEKMRCHGNLKTVSKSVSSSANVIWDLALDVTISKKFSRSCSHNELCSHGSSNNCTDMQIAAAVESEIAEEQTMENDADFDEMLFGYKTGEILEFFREYSCNVTVESLRSQPKLQNYSILDMKKLKFIRLSRFSKSSRFCTNHAEMESPRSKFIALLMKNLSSRSKPKCSNAENNFCGIKSGCDCNNKSQRESLHVHKVGGRQCLLSMFNVDRSFNIEGNIETLVVTDHKDNIPGVSGSLKDGSHVCFRDPVKTLSNEFILLNFCPNEGDDALTKLDETTGCSVVFNEATGRRNAGFRSAQELAGQCRLSRSSMADEEAVFGGSFSINRSRRSKEIEFSQNLMSGRVSADAFSDSSSDLFELEFFNHK